MVKRDKITNFINKKVFGQKILEDASKNDSYANGVQIVGKENVNKIAVSVSPSMDFFREAVKSKADYIVMHHGLDLTDKNIINARLHPGLQKRLEIVFKNKLTVAGYHYALDVHPKIGNNAMIINQLGAQKTDQTYYDGWGWVAEFKKPQKVEDIAKKCSHIFQHDVFAVYSGPKKIKRVGVCSGAAKPYGDSIWEIINKDIDLHISGEIAEPGPAFAKDMGFNYFSCGHYATEVFGIQELGKKIKQEFKDKIEVEFIDISNPL